MRSAIKIAALVSIPIEIANFWLASFPVDTGFPAGTTWYVKAIAYQWLCLHTPGLLLAFRLDGTHLAQFDNVILFVSGYLDTVVLIYFVILAVRGWYWFSGREHLASRK